MRSTIVDRPTWTAATMSAAVRAGRCPTCRSTRRTDAPRRRRRRRSRSEVRDPRRDRRKPLLRAALGRVRRPVCRDAVGEKGWVAYSVDHRRRLLRALEHRDVLQHEVARRLAADEASVLDSGGAAVGFEHGRGERPACRKPRGHHHRSRVIGGTRSPTGVTRECPHPSRTATSMLRPARRSSGERPSSTCSSDGSWADQRPATQCPGHRRRRRRRARRLRSRQRGRRAPLAANVEFRPFLVRRSVRCPWPNRCLACHRRRQAGPRGARRGSRACSRRRRSISNAAAGSIARSSYTAPDSRAAARSPSVSMAARRRASRACQERIGGRGRPRRGYDLVDLHGVHVAQHPLRRSSSSSSIRRSTTCSRVTESSASLWHVELHSRPTSASRRRARRHLSTWRVRVAAISRSTPSTRQHALRTWSTNVVHASCVRSCAMSQIAAAQPERISVHDRQVVVVERVEFQLPACCRLRSVRRSSRFSAGREQMVRAFCRFLHPDGRRLDPQDWCDARVAFERNVDLIAASAIRMVKTIEAAGFDAEVVTCPTWDGRADRPPGDGSPVGGCQPAWRRPVGGAEPDRDPRAVEDLGTYFRAGVDGLVTAREAPDDVEALVFLNDAATQAILEAAAGYETTIHMVDALSAKLGLVPSAAEAAIDSDVAVDRIDELLCGFFTQGRSKIFDGTEYDVDVGAHSSDRRWTVRVAERMTAIADSAGGAHSTSPDRRTRSTSHCGTRRRGRSHRRRRPARPLARRPTGALGLTTAIDRAAPAADDGARIGHRPARRPPRRRSRGRGRIRCRRRGRARRCARVGRDRPATAQGVALDLDGQRDAGGPCVEPGRRAAQRPACGADRPIRAFTVAEEARCGAGSAAGRHRPSSRPRRDRRRARRQRRRQRVRRAPARTRSAGCPASGAKPRPRLWRLMPVFGSAIQEPRPGVRLDDRHAHAVAVDGAQVRGVAPVAGAVPLR